MHLREPHHPLVQAALALPAQWHPGLLPRPLHPAPPAPLHRHSTTVLSLPTLNPYSQTKLPEVHQMKITRATDA